MQRNDTQYRAAASIDQYGRSIASDAPAGTPTFREFRGPPENFGHLAGRSLPARKVQSRDYVWLSLYVRQSMDHYPLSSISQVKRLH